MDIEGLEIKKPKLVDKKSDNLSKAVAIYNLHKETFEEAWERIMAMKNSAPQEEKLLEVLEAMKNGDIGRNPDKVNKKFSRTEALDLWEAIEAERIEKELQEMVDNIPDNYHLITDEPHLNRMIEVLSKEEWIVFDVETTGVDVYEDYIVGNVLTAVSKDLHFYIPTKHDTDDFQLDHELVMNKLKSIYEDETINKIAHNSKFDIQMLTNEGIDVNGFIWDTQEAMKLLNENERSFALKPLVDKYLKIPSKTYGQLFGKKGFNEIDLKLALAYAAKDGDVTNKLKDFQVKHMKKMPEVYKYCVEVEMPLIPIIVRMERLGFEIDVEYAEKLGKELSEEVNELGKLLKEEFGDINMNSPVQLKKAIEESIGREISNTNADDTLKPLSKEYEIIKVLLRYREINKLYGTYINTLPNLINNKTGRLHTVFNQNGAVTGRFSSGGAGVNLQNQDPKARPLFVAPEGYVWLGGDFSQQEYRALAYFSQEPSLVENYKKGNDLYSTVASEVFDKPIEECGDGSIYRDNAKVILLATVYGTGARTLSNQLGSSVKEAQKFLDNFKTRYPTVAKWIEGNRRFVQRHGFVWMDGHKRKRRLPDARNQLSDNWYKSVFTQSTNAIIQGSASIQTKMCLIKLSEYCKMKTEETGKEWEIVMPIHDEIIIQVPEDITKEEVDEFENIMLNTYIFGDIPNKIDLAFYKRWTRDGVKVEEWFDV